MLYTLIGNGNANPTETIATLESLASAVEAPDEFWMLFMAPVGTDLSDTAKAILAWLDDNGIYYEVVVTEGVDLHPELKNADETHVARRPLDFLLKATKHRVQPDENAALLVLSTDLDHDDDALFAVERAGVEGFPVFDLGGQMTQIVLDDEDEPVVTINPTTNGGIAVDSPPDEGVTVTPTPPEEGKLSDSQLIDTQMHQSAVEANEAEPDLRPMIENPEVLEGRAVVPTMIPNPAVQAAPLSYTMEDLVQLTRDELKALVKTQGVTPTDMRSKGSMIEALMAKQGEMAEESIQRGIDQVVAGNVVDLGSFAEPDIEGKDIDPSYTAEPVAVSDEFRDKVLDLTDGIVRTYLLKVISTGALILQEIPSSKLPLVETILAEE